MAGQKLLDRVRSELRTNHYSIRTEKTYMNRIKRFILFHNRRHPEDMGAVEIKAFVDNLAVNHHVSSASQNQES